MEDSIFVGIGRMRRCFGGKLMLESLYREVGGNYLPKRQVDMITIALAMYTGSQITC